LADADATAAANPAEPNPKRELETSYRVSTEVVENKLLKDVVRPGGLELPTFWFVASRPTLPNLARADASEAKSVT